MLFNYNTSTYSLNINGKYLNRFILSSLLIFALTYFLTILTPSGDAVTSLIFSSLIGIIPVLLYSHILLKDSVCKKILIIAYIIKTIWGIVHYLYFIDPNYFNRPNIISITNIDDYVAGFQQISIYSKYSYLTLDIIKDHAIMPHPEMYALMSLFYKNIGLYILTIVPINVISSCFTATMISYITKLRNGNFRLILFLCACYPESLISSMYIRDLFAAVLVTFCICSVVLSTGWKRLLFIILSTYIISLQRLPYIIVPILAYIICLFSKSSGKNSKYTIYAFLALIISIAFGSQYFLGAFEGQESYMSSISNILLYVLFPIRFIQCMIGPFPWSQAFETPLASYYIQEFFLSAALFYTVYKIFPLYWKDIKAHRELDYMSVVGLLIMLIPIFSSSPHILYVGFGLVYLTPMFSRIKFSIKNFISFNVKFFAFMIVASFIWISLKFGGTSSIFK